MVVFSLLLVFRQAFQPDVHLTKRRFHQNPSKKDSVETVNHPKNDEGRISVLKHIGIRESQRDSVPKPRVARHEKPWGQRQKISTPTGLRPVQEHRGH